MPQSDTRAAWVKHARGDTLTDAELDACIAQIEAALPYLEERPGYGLARTPTRQTLITLISYRAARQEDKRSRKPASAV